MLSPDNVIAGRYRIVAIIGQGSYGKVYLGHDAELDRDVAIKELQRSTESGSEELWAAYQQRFRKEAHILSRFSHPNVVIAYGLEQDDAGDMYLILEYVDGKSLKELLESGKPLSTDQALSIAIDIGQAIEAIVQARYRTPRHQAGQYSGRARWHRPSSPISAWPRVGHETHRTQEAVDTPARRPTNRRSKPLLPATWISAQTSIPWAWCSTRCSPGNSMCVTTFLLISTIRMCRPLGCGGDEGAARGTRLSATRPLRKCVTTWSKCAARTHWASYASFWTSCPWGNTWHSSGRLRCFRPAWASIGWRR